MKILLLAPQPFFQHRGTPIAVKLLAEVLSNNGHDICLLTYHEGEHIKIPNVDIRRIPPIPGVHHIPPGFSLKKIICDGTMLFKCFKILAKNKFDIVHAVEESVFIAIILKYMFGLPFVYDMDSSLSQQITDKFASLHGLRGFFGWFENVAITQSIGVIAVCRALEIIALNHAPAKSILRLEDISLIETETQKGENLRATLGINGPVIMYIGNLERYQGIDLLIESFQLAHKNNNAANLIIIGGTIDHIEKYKKKSNQLGVEKQTHFIGQKPISELGSFLNQADVLVSPRIQGENTPMKIYSYLDSGKPLVATDLPTHTQVLDDTIAILVKPEGRSMADAFTWALKEQGLANIIALKAKERVRQEYSYNAFTKKLCAFYKSLEHKIFSPRIGSTGDQP